MKEHNTLLFVFLFFSLFVLLACNNDNRGFALPDGNIENGKVTFIELGCNYCHSTSDVERLDMGEDVDLILGGEVKVGKSYAALVTSIIYPEHTIAPAYKKTAEDKEKTKMKNYNDVMTVQELVNLVTYLKEEYKIKIPASYNRYY
jgi:cytochrome c2